MPLQSALFVGSELALFASVPLQAVDPATVVDLPATYRAAVAFLSSTLAGGAVNYWYGNRIKAAVEASTENLPLAVLYGFFAYSLAGFLVAYGFTQFARLGVSASVGLILGGVALGGALLTLGGVGYVVVGAWIADLAGFSDPWIGLLAVGLVGAVAVLALPFLLGAVAWFAIAAVGIGGSVRRWIHADAARRTANRH
ncbi:hypothetical protein [Halobellus captivus]|uniref:hypothetical protein n=1 Tax=Halobellus captivus TaxID=2592614 RepID=UPI0011A6E7FE|nr:hypothetical protein [Halobellus captivus]